MSDFRKQELLKDIKNRSLQDVEFWEGVMEYFNPQEIKTLRKLIIGDIKIDHHNLTVDNFKVRQRIISDEKINQIFGKFIAAQLRELFGDPWEYLEDKHNEGLISWTEEDEEERFYDCLWGGHSSNYQTSKNSDCNCDYGDGYRTHDPRHDPMGGGLGLGYDGEYDDDEEF